MTDPRASIWDALGCLVWVLALTAFFLALDLLNAWDIVTWI